MKEQQSPPLKTEEEQEFHVPNDTIEQKSSPIIMVKQQESLSFDKIGLGDDIPEGKNALIGNSSIESEYLVESKS